ncbi:MAG: DUF1631 family protein [Candidatus Accumulibacter sp.]|uniref:DUF1631 family protein n=1 Tax=Accumulibacter sp. TaxID=2053492 RepID=UPI0025DE5657|nr:DUF1631 family protein [Accumulibacter sp.]MCP5248083.1 DUF1631 family protein [Accumulibacter sp.]
MEDPFEVLRASRELFLNRLREIVGQAGVAGPSLLEAFADEVGSAFDQLASTRPRDEFDEAGDLTASRLTLMGDDQLEVDIRIRDIGSRLRDAGGRDLWRSQLRYMTLLRRPKMKDAGNPVGPEAICHGLWAIGAAGGGDLAQTLAQLDRVEERLRQKLSGLYREIDALLAAHGIEPAAVQNAPSAAGADAQRAVGSEAGGNPLSALQQAMRQRREADQPAVPGQLAGGGGDPRAGNPTLDTAAMVMVKHLFDRLTLLEARSATASGDTGAGGSASRPPLSALKSTDLDLPLGKPEAIALDTMAMIFEAIFDASELPDTVKAAIGRLQIPLLKRAIVDPSLFANDTHPARLLINRMARAAIGLPRDAGWQHPVCKRIGAVTAAVRDALGKDDTRLDPHLAELEALIAERDQAIRLAAAGHVLLVVGHEKEQQATQLARRWLQASLARAPAPAIAVFLEKYWWRVMVAAALAGGSDGTRWREDSATAQDLVWSVEPKPTADERKRLASVASSLVRRIAAGLDEIGVAGPERVLFLNTLFDLQTAALRAQAATATAPPEAPDDSGYRAAGANPGPTLDSGPRILEGDGLRVHHLGMSASPLAPRRPSASDWQVGDWLRFPVPDQEPLTGLCCWQSPSSATVVLFNPDWGGNCAFAIAGNALDQQLRAGHAQIVSRMTIFDAAAERALSLLGKS